MDSMETEDVTGGTGPEARSCARGRMPRGDVQLQRTSPAGGGARALRPRHALQIDPREQDLRRAERAAVPGAEARLRLDVLLERWAPRKREHLPQRLGLGREYGPGPDRDQPQRLQERVQHRGELLPP